MNLLVCFALKEEAAPFQKMAAGGLRRGHHVSILLTGIGRRNAEKSLCEFLAANLPGLVLTCGFAGGLNPDLKLGEVVFETDPFFSRSRGNETQTKKNLETPHVVSYEKLLAAGAKPAKFFYTDRIAITADEKKRLRAETGADAVEMESAAIHAVCRERGIPCATVRVISDTANEDLPLDFNQLYKSDMSLDYGKLALAILMSPGKIGALMRLQKQTKLAAGKLAAVLEKITFQ